MENTETRLVALDALKPSAANSRRTAASKSADDELRASIAAHGLLENLVVRMHEPDGKPPTFEVVAGGRRLRALRDLADAGQVPADMGVPCRVVDKDADDHEISLAENYARTSMNVADQLAAFKGLTEQGRTTEEIADRFGITTDNVRRVLRLANIAPEIIEAARNGEIGLEALRAFGATADQDRQLQVWKRIDRNYIPNAAWIRSEVLSEGVAATHPHARFVGVEAYEKARGVVERDLFAQEDQTRMFLLDQELLTRLANERLAEEASKLTGWKWVSPTLELSWDTIYKLGRVQGRAVPATADEEKEQTRLGAHIDALREQMSALQEQADAATAAAGSEPDNGAEENAAIICEEQLDKLERECNAAEEEADELRDRIANRRLYTDEEKAYSGCIVTIDREGGIRVESGLVRPGDEPAEATSAGEDGTDDETVSGEEGGPSGYVPPVHAPAARDKDHEAREEAGYSGALASELSHVRGALIKDALCGRFDLAMVLVTYQLARALLPGSRSYNGALSLSAPPTTNVPYAAKDAKAFEKGSPGIPRLEERRKALPTDWARTRSEVKAFREFRALGRAAHERIFAWCAAQMLQHQLSIEEVAKRRPEIEAITGEMEIAFAELYRPGTADYWMRVRKGDMTEVAEAVLGKDWVFAHRNDTKTVLAEAMGAAFADDPPETAGLNDAQRAAAAAWAPPGFAPDPKVVEAARPEDTETAPAKSDDKPKPRRGRRRTAAKKANGKAAEGRAPQSGGEERKPNGSAGPPTTAGEGFETTPASEVPAFMRQG